MPREDSLDSSGGSLTSEDEQIMSPTTATAGPPTGTSVQWRDNPSTVPSRSVAGSNVPVIQVPVPRSKSKSSAGAGTSSASAQTPTSPVKGIVRFRQAANKVIAMHRTSAALFGDQGPGAEPGINTRSSSAFAAYGHIRENCEIEVVDYSALKFSIRQFDNRSFVKFLKGRESKREPWAKVRWINIGGISWDVVQALQETYDLHSLSVEDVLHRRRTARSKADYYLQHLFIHILCHSLQEDDASPLQALGFEPPARTASPSRMSFDLPKSPVEAIMMRRRRTTRRTRHTQDMENGPTVHFETPERQKTYLEEREDTQRAFEAADRVIDELKSHEDRVQVKVRSLYVFMMRDGTLISMHQSDRGFGDPIIERLKRTETVLRANADVSMLLHALLDLVVDRAIDIADKYHSVILKLERQVLLRPKMRTVRNLHVVSGDLTLHRRTLEPLKTLIYGLRRYDLDRCIAVAASAEAGGTTQVRGFLSHKSKIYLADVHDHCDFILSSFSMFESITENLINYTFNMISYEMNEVMRRLTLATIIFLPLTLLAGYFGMNFEIMPSVYVNGVAAEDPNNTGWSGGVMGSDVFYWVVAFPVLAVIMALFLWDDFVRLIHFISKKVLVRRTLVSP